MLERSSAKKRKDRLMSLGDQHPLLKRGSNIFKDVHDNSPIEIPIG